MAGLLAFAFHSSPEDIARQQAVASAQAEKERVNAEISASAEAARVKRQEEQQAIVDKYWTALDAWTMAQQFVTGSLKSPSTADYGSLLDGTAQTYTDHTKQLKDGSWEAWGWVDSQNSFGATVRNDFRLVLRKVSGDKWQLIDAKMTQR